jgi:hypothetical protein
MLGDAKLPFSGVLSTTLGDIMRTPLQEYEAVTRQLIWISTGLLVGGTTIYMLWFSMGAVIAILGFVGLVMCYMRR